MNEDTLNVTYVLMVGTYRHRECGEWEEANDLRNDLKGQVLNVWINVEQRESVPA